MPHSKPDPTGVWGLAAVLLALAGLLLWLSMLAGPWRLVDGLRDASAHLDRAQAALSKGALKTARYETLAGRAAAARARDGLSSPGPLLDVARLSPTVDNAMKEIDHLVVAAELSSHAAVGTLEVAQNALRGKDKIITKEDPDDPKSDSIIRIDRVRAIGRTITRVRNDIEGVRRELEAVRLTNLPRRFRPRIERGVRRAARTDDVLADAEAGFEVLPAFLGADGRRNYLIGMQNSAELRGTGGAMLQFAVLSIDDGKPELAKDASTVYDVDRNRQPLDIPLPADAWYLQGIPDARRFGNANWSPDWPFSARSTVLYGQETERVFPDVDLPPIDGVMVVDPIVMKELTPGVGRFRSSKYRVYVTGQTIVDYLLYRAYATKPVPRVRKARLRDVVDDFYVHMLRPAHPTEMVQGLGKALATKHMQIWLADADEQAFVERMDWDGALRPATGSDYLDVVQQNVGGNKLDYHAEIETAVEVVPEGADALVSTTVGITNDVFLPQPRWALGNSGPNHRPMVNVYVQQDAELIEASVTPPDHRVDAAAEGISAWTGDRPAEHVELGKKVWSVTLGDPNASPPGMPPGTTSRVRYGYRVPGVIRTSGERKEYRLVLQHQPTARPTTTTVRLRLPGSARSITAEGWRRSRTARHVVLEWERRLTTDEVLEVSWRS